MATRRVAKSVLRNFLGTLTSRYSDWQGYWLLGFVVIALEEPLDYDLLDAEVPGSPDQTPITHIRWLARVKFLEQLSKAGLDPTRIREANLIVERLPARVEVRVERYTSAGYRVRFIVRAITDLGRAYESEQIVAVAPHNPAHERQSRGASE
jgi:hypothetical protein